MPERLANRLKERRAELGLTQAELAERVGVTRKTVNTVENGVFTPSATLAIKGAQALALSVEQLLWIERRAGLPAARDRPRHPRRPIDACPTPAGTCQALRLS